MILHRNEREILRVLYKEYNGASLREISMMTGMSWVTTKKYILKCIEKQIVMKEGRMYSFHPYIIKELLKRKK